eukprot:TRINITY_DN12154_c0_g2_i1.p1 TRINITY_DN12154_c0_g2~~TRINITY_DN12154_c0_g2_i1.p1  ORF type:complete len:153 (-),score=14.46 TRINITY_DN12154_c0_g2_i1:93-551(-)
MSDEKKPAAFGSGDYNIRNHFTTNLNTNIWRETLKKEQHFHRGWTKSRKDDPATTTSSSEPLADTYFSLFTLHPRENKKSETDFYDRTHVKSEEKNNHNYCTRCKEDRYFCRHRCQSPPPKSVYKLPVTSSQEMGWRDSIEPMDKTHMRKRL